MASTINLPYPPRWINAYIFDKLSEYEDIGVSKTQKFSPIFATSPTNIEDIYKEVEQSSKIPNPLVIQYDRLIRFRPNAFYPYKREQVLYYLYSTSLANVNNAAIVISQLLDREDAAAQDLNDWASKNPQSSGDTNIPHNVFFHSMKVYQTDESVDVMNSTSARTIYAAKMIVEYDYHAKDGSTYR